MDEMLILWRKYRRDKNQQLKLLGTSNFFIYIFSNKYVDVSAWTTDWLIRMCPIENSTQSFMGLRIVWNRNVSTGISFQCYAMCGSTTCTVLTSSHCERSNKKEVFQTRTKNDLSQLRNAGKAFLRTKVFKFCFGGRP